MPEDIVRARCRDVVAPDHDTFRSFVPGIVVAIREPLGRVQDTVITLDSLHPGHSRAVAGDAAKGEHDVGAAVGIGQHADPGADVPAGSHREDHALWTELVLDLTHPLFDEVKCFVPRNLLPLSLSALPYPLEWMGQPVGVVDILGHRQASSAKTPLIPGMFGVTFDLDELAVLDVGQHPAPTVTAGPGGPGSGAHDLVFCGFHPVPPSVRHIIQHISG